MKHLLTDVNGFLGSILSRSSQDVTAADPKEETIDTESVEAGVRNSLCWGQQRFAIPKDSYERLTIKQVEPKPEDDKITKVRIVNESARVHIDTPAGGPADLLISVPPPPPAPPKADYSAAAIFIFANARIPRYGASIALGADFGNLTSHRSCVAESGCVPAGAGVSGSQRRRQLTVATVFGRPAYAGNAVGSPSVSAQRSL